MSDPLVAARALHFAAVATFAGLFVFLCFVGEPAFRASRCPPTSLRKQMRAVGWISLALAAVSGATWFFLLAFELSGRTGKPAFSVARTLLTETQFGSALLVRLGLAGLLSLALLRSSPARGWRSRAGARLSAALAACLIASLAWAGHAGGDSGTSGTLEFVADALHLVAAAGWVGSLPPLLLVLAFARRSNDEPSRAMAADAARRFSRLGLVSVSALLVTGIVNTYFLVGSVPGLLGTDYGRLLLVKVALFAVMIAFAAVNRVHLLPRISPESRAAALGRVERNGLVELGLGLIVFVIVGALGTMPPAAHTRAWWPFALRLSTDAWFAPEQRLECAGILAAAILGTLALLAAIPATRWRWRMAAAAVLLLAWGGSRLSLITAEAFPTSFFVSPTGYSAHSIAAGRALFAEHCVSCHGEQGRGDGPAAQYLGSRPADLTAAHIYDHSDGDLFWWIANGVGEMPGFSAALDETARWNLIDFLHANADALRLSEATDAAGVALPLPEFSLECGEGSLISVGQLRGNVVHLVLAGPTSAARLRQLAAMRTQGEITMVVRLAGSERSPLCSTADADAIAAFTVYRGTADEVDGTEFLVDTSGWLRAMWFPGRHPDWEKPEILAGEIAAIRHAPGRPRPSAGTGAHAHSH